MVWLAVVIISAFAAAVILGQVTQAKASRLLTPEQSNQVTTILVMGRLWWIFFQLYLAIGFGLIFLFHIPLPPILSSIFLIIGVAMFIWSQLGPIRQLRRLALPSRYVRMFARARLLIFSPWIALGVFMIYDVVSAGQ